MSEPTFEDGPPVPLMTEGVIDEATLRQLLADLREHAFVLGVREKSGPELHAGIEEWMPADAVDRLCDGKTRAVQIRYRFDDREWTDTIMRVPSGFQIVRCRHEN